MYTDNKLYTGTSVQNQPDEPVNVFNKTMLIMHDLLFILNIIFILLRTI